MYPLPRLEDERLDCLHDLGILYSEPTETFDRICELAASHFGLPTAFVSFVDAQEQWFKAKVGLDLTGTSRDVAFCAHTIMSDDVMVVEDAHSDPRFRNNPLVTGNPHLRFYAGAPLVFAPGLRIGTMCVADTQPRKFGKAEKRMLGSYAAIVLSELRLLSAARMLRRGLEDNARLRTKLAGLRPTAARIRTA